MRVLHVKVERGDKFLIAQAMEEPGILTQGRNFDELIVNVRDAAALLLQDNRLHLELVVPADLVIAAKRSGRKSVTIKRKQVA
jgi:predicted RNase H-like HicB family nuclease